MYQYNIHAKYPVQCDTLKLAIHLLFLVSPFWPTVWLLYCIIIVLYYLRCKNIFFSYVRYVSDLILKKLQIIKSVDFKQEREAGKNERLKISFDLYLPSPAFRKASPGLPNYRITVVG